MWHTVVQAGVSNVGIDLTNELSLLGFGLVGLLWLAAGMLVSMAVQHYRSHAQDRLPELPPACVDCQQAA